MSKVQSPFALTDIGPWTLNLRLIF
jgi:hypothetical protein